MAGNITQLNVTQMQTPNGLKLGYHPILIIIATIICISNCLVLVLFSTQSFLRSPSNYLLFSLAISDLAVGLVGIPAYITCEMILSWSTCLSSYSINRFIAISTVYHILWITLEKYIAIIFPLQHKSHFDRRKVVLTTLTTWCASFLVTFVELAWLVGHSDPYKRYSDDVKQKEFIYNSVTFSVCFALPIILMVFAYASIFLRIIRQHSSILRKHTTRGEVRARRMPAKIKSALLFFTLLFIFILCWFWWFFVIIYNLFTDDNLPPFPEIVYDILTAFRFSTSFVNPLLYTFFKRDFKKALTKLVNGARLNPAARHRSLGGSASGIASAGSETAVSHVSRENLPPYLGFPQGLRRM